ncbi:hypothetical protein [Kitasatospora aureofaciens]|uniref:hypothetical protein n=1 Tax=Kitasatospora aureofaciens TaxID=1894 RepID=UPI000AD3C247|nr:hypothetical protein [Kitasatospora aureofaciens]HJD85489.1 hypothetical protein [Kitasatospora aureofaciens]
MVGFFFNFALFGTIFMLGLFFQHAQGASPFVAGVCSLGLTAISASTPYWIIAVGIGVACLGSGIVSPGMTAAMVDSAGRSTPTSPGPS